MSLFNLLGVWHYYPDKAIIWEYGDLLTLMISKNVLIWSKMLSRNVHYLIILPYQALIPRGSPQYFYEAVKLFI